MVQSKMVKQVAYCLRNTLVALAAFRFAIIISNTHWIEHGHSQTIITT